MVDTQGTELQIPYTDCLPAPNEYNPYPNYSHLDMELYTWTGSYGTFADAVAHNAYVGYSGVFSQTLYFAEPPPIPPDLSNMPAIIMKHDLLGDANYDGKVDINDLTIVLTNYNQTAGMSWTGDFNNDGKVDINDLTIVLTHYNQSTGLSAGGGLSAVPEPSILLLATGLFGLLTLARRWRVGYTVASTFELTGRWRIRDGVSHFRPSTVSFFSPCRIWSVSCSFDRNLGNPIDNKWGLPWWNCWW